MTKRDMSITKMRGKVGRTIPNWILPAKHHVVWMLSYISSLPLFPVLFGTAVPASHSNLIFIIHLPRYAFFLLDASVKHKDTQLTATAYTL